MDFIPAASPHLEAPRHLAPYVELLDRTVGNSVEACIAAPPQNGKTEATKHAIAKWLLTTSRVPFYYITYSQTRSDAVASDFWILAEQVGLKPDGRKAYWRSQVTRSTVMFTSIGGAMTGFPLPADAVIIIDDPIKDRADGLSRAKRQTAWGWLFGTVMTRRHPGSSVICMATRWAPDDPTGNLIEKFGFEYINLPAICEDPETDPLGREAGEILWSHHSLTEYERLRVADPWGFAAMYQGRPAPRGAEVFSEDPPRFTELPEFAAVRTTYGVDLAYTAKTSADRSVCLRMQRFGADPTTYVTGCRAAHTDAPSFCRELQSMQAARQGPMRWYTGGGGEKGVAAFIAEKVPKLDAIPATTDKLVRATPVSEAWNSSLLALPDTDSPLYGTWVEDLLTEVRSFTGINDQHDDFVDALAAGFDAFGSVVDLTPSIDVNRRLAANKALQSRWGADVMKPRFMGGGLGMFSSTPQSSLPRRVAPVAAPPESTPRQDAPPAAASASGDYRVVGPGAISRTVNRQRILITAGSVIHLTDDEARSYGDAVAPIQ